VLVSGTREPFLPWHTLARARRVRVRRAQLTETAHVNACAPYTAGGLISKTLLFRSRVCHDVVALRREVYRIAPSTESSQASYGGVMRNATLAYLCVHGSRGAAN
jgi:hypothetical protein